MSGTGRRNFFNPLVAGFIAGVVLAAVLVLLAKINLDLAAPWTHTHTLTAQVADVDGLNVSSDVRIAGRIVGQVTDVRSHGSSSTVTFHVDDADWPLPATTTASVRLATLLGQKYLELEPGLRSAQGGPTLAENGDIGLQATRPVVDFDQVLNTFDKPTRDSLTSLLRTVSGAVKGQEGTIQQLIPDLSYLSVHSTIPTGELATRNPEINNILINLGITADQLDASRNDLAAVIDNSNSITATLAANQGRALTGFITNTDTLNITTHAVLGGESVALDSGLQKLSGFAHDFNTLLTTLIPETTTFTQPVPQLEPSDVVNGNGGIPAKAGIDLIYEIGDATSQGYGSHNFGTASQPNFQGNFFLRQNLQGFESCYQNNPPCTWGQTGPSGASNLPVAATAPAPAPATPLPTPAPAPSTAPVLTPPPSPSASPSPSTAPTATPSPTAIPSPSPSSAGLVTPPPAASPSPSAALASTSVWDVLFVFNS